MQKHNKYRCFHTGTLHSWAFNIQSRSVACLKSAEQAQKNLDPDNSIRSSDSEIGFIVGAQLAGVSVTNTTTLTRLVFQQEQWLKWRLNLDLWEMHQ